MNPRINFLTYNFGATKTALIGLQPPANFDMSFIVFTNSVPQHKCVDMADIELPRRSNKSSKFNSDTWSIGCVLYYLLTKQDPFEGRTVAETKSNILNLKIDRNNALGQHDNVFSTLVYKCLERD